MSGHRTYEELIERSDSTHLKESAKASFVISYYYVRSTTIYDTCFLELYPSTRNLTIISLSLMESMKALPTPVTVITGFLGSGKTTLILNLLPQLPKTYKVVDISLPDTHGAKN